VTTDEAPPNPAPTPSAPAHSGEEKGADPRDSVLAFLLGFGLAFRPLAGMDAPWHLAMGQAHLKEGPWLSEDPISWIAGDRPSDMGAWLGQVLFALAEQIGGLGLARALVAGVAGLLLVVVHRIAARRTGRRNLAALAVALTAALALHRFRLRPDVFSLLMAVLVLDRLDRGAEGGEGADGAHRRALVLFALCALWTNLHPGVVVAPLFAAALWGLHRRRRGGLALLACLLGASLRPRGPLDLIDIAWETARTGPLVPEWSGLWKLDFGTFLGEWLLLLGIGALWFATSLRGARRLSAAALLEFLALGLGARAVRLLYFLAWPAIGALERLAPRLEGRPLANRAVWLLALLLIVLMPGRDRVDAALRAREAGLSPWADVYEPNYPRGAADFLAGHRLQGRLFHPVKWGGFLGRELMPHYRSAHDGRITYFGKELAAELLGFADPALRPGIVDRHGLEILVLPPGLLRPDEILAAGQRPEGGRRWLPLYADPVAAVFMDARGEHATANLDTLRGRGR
jgi:hypothetical protein